MLALSQPWVPTHYLDFPLALQNSSPADARLLTRQWLRTDLWWLLVWGMGRLDLVHPWLFDRCREVQASPDGHLDLWARGHYKSTIITFAKTIQDILASHGEEPLPHWKGLEPTFVIFSHTRPAAKAFLRQIKNEFERNGLLREVFPDVLYEVPEKQSPRWSEDNGIVVRRHSNPKEATVEAWGLVDGQPTGKHWNVMNYDDTVVRDSVASPEMIAKTTEAWELSLNLGDAAPRKRYIGTRWHFADSYRTMLERGAALPRIHPATDDGTLTGKPVFLEPDQLAAKMKDMGPYSASSQLLLNPIADSKQTFRREWLEHRFNQPELSWQGMNRVILCDPASGKKNSDYTAIAVIGKAADKNTYLIDFMRDRLNLKDRVSEFIRLHKKYSPQFAGYESYGLQADIEYLKLEQTRLTYHFEVTEVAGKLSKADRINRLIPLCADGHLWLPESIYRTSAEGKLEELIAILVEQEFLAWPVPVHDDGMDVIARLFDMPDLDFPMAAQEPHRDDRYSRKGARRGSWMSG